MNCLRSIGSWDHGFESHTRHRCLVCVYSVCVVLCLGRGLATNWSLAQGVLPSVKNDHETEKEARAHGGCTARENNSPCGPSSLFQFLNPYRVGRTPWTGDEPVSRSLPTHRTRTQNKGPDIHASKGIRSYDPSVRASENGSWLSPRFQCDQQSYNPTLYNYGVKRGNKSIEHNINQSMNAIDVKTQVSPVSSVSPLLVYSL
jgi:hypothetical protein